MLALTVASPSTPSNSNSSRTSASLASSTSPAKANATFSKHDPGYPPQSPRQIFFSYPQRPTPSGYSDSGTDVDFELDVGLPPLPRSLPLKPDGFGQHRARAPSPPPPELPPKPAQAPRLPPKPKQTQTEEDVRTGSDSSLNRSREIIHPITILEVEEDQKNVRRTLMNFQEKILLANH